MLEYKKREIEKNYNHKCEQNAIARLEKINEYKD
jgi:hypothetical protein